MRLTITLPDDLVAEACELAGGRPLRELVRDALRERVERLRRERLTREMDDGYRAAAEGASPEPEWATIETEGM